MSEFVQTHERRRRTQIDNAILTVLKNYGCRVATACLHSEVDSESRYGLIRVSRDEIYNSLTRLRNRGLVSGGMRYKGSRGWKLHSESPAQTSNHSHRQPNALYERG